MGVEWVNEPMPGGLSLPASRFDRAVRITKLFLGLLPRFEKSRNVETTTSGELTRPVHDFFKSSKQVTGLPLMLEQVG